MGTVHSEPDKAAWRILLFAKNGSELMMLRRPSGLCLPVLHVPLQERVAASLNAAAQRVWQVETLCVVPLDIAHPDGASGSVRYHVMEVRKADELSRIAPRCLNVETLRPDTFSDVRDYLAVRRAMKLDVANSSHDAPGPFSECGTFHEISTWVEEQLEPLGRRCTGAFRQLHASDSFALIWFETNDGAAWFKATGEPNRRELPLTRTLSALFPKFTPQIIGLRTDWNAWLTDEAQGMDLETDRNLASWCRAAESLAELQIASIGKTSRVAASGGHDASVRGLLPQVAPFFAEIENLMEAQIKTEPRRLHSQEIRNLELQVTETLNELETTGIPDTLNHFDLNPGNTIVGPKDCKFLDWAEAAVGNPFFSFEYLYQHFLQAFGAEVDAPIEFRNAYSKVWRAVLPEVSIERAVELMPLLAPFAFAVRALPWRNSQPTARAESAGFLRSLARRMHREAELLTGRAARVF